VPTGSRKLDPHEPRHDPPSRRSDSRRAGWRARHIVPEIHALAQETERHRNLSPQIVERIRKAELLRACQPAEFGGFEYDGEVALKIGLQISAGCASTGWTIKVAISNGMVLAHWPIEAQRDLARRRRSLQLRLRCADRHRGSRHGRLPIEWEVVIRQRLRHRRMRRARRDDRPA